MSILETLEKMWTEDSPINQTDLTDTTLATVKLHSKYMKYYNAAKLQLKRLESDKDKLLLLKTDYYLGNLDHQTLKDNNWSPNKRVILKTDLPLHMNADNEIIAANLKIAEVTQVVTFLDSVIRSINNRGFHIKNILDYEKFINGTN